MTIQPQFTCHHTQWTGYDGYCVCIECGKVIRYEDICLEKNSESVENYIFTVLKQIDARFTMQVEFDIAVSNQGTVVEGGKNRVKFVVTKESNTKEKQVKTAR